MPKFVPVFSLKKPKHNVYVMFMFMSNLKGVNKTWNFMSTDGKYTCPLYKA